MTSRASRSPLDELRDVAAGVAPAPEVMRSYLAKVRNGAFAVTDADVEALKAAGLTEDEIFEQTVAGAVGEGIRRLDAATRAIG